MEDLMVVVRKLTLADHGNICNCDCSNPAGYVLVVKAYQSESHLRFCFKHLVELAGSATAAVNSVVKAGAR